MSWFGIGTHSLGWAATSGRRSGERHRRGSTRAPNQGSTLVASSRWTHCEFGRMLWFRNQVSAESGLCRSPFPFENRVGPADPSPKYRTCYCWQATVDNSSDWDQVAHGLVILGMALMDTSRVDRFVTLRLPLIAPLLTFVALFDVDAPSLSLHRRMLIDLQQQRDFSGISHLQAGQRPAPPDL